MKHDKELKYRKKLNTDQIAILKLLYDFRFATCKQIAEFQQKQATRPVQNRLKILEDQGLIAKRYDKSYKLRGKPAAYYLTPKGTRTLAEAIPRKPDEPLNFKRIYKERDVSENFIEHCLNILQTFLVLRRHHSAKGTLRYFTKSHISYEQYDYFPRPLPDAFIYIGSGKSERQFFLDIFEDTQPFFVLIRRIKSYLNYSENGSWEDTGTNLPIILIACANTSMQKRLRKRIAKEIQDSYTEDVTFATTTIEMIKNSESAKIWLASNEDSDDPDNPQAPVDLASLGSYAA